MDPTPRPPLHRRLRPWQWLAVDAVATAGYALFGYGVLGARITPGALGLAGTVLACAALLAARWFPVPAMAVPLVLFWLSPMAGGLAWLAALPLAYALFRVAERHTAPVSWVALAAGLTGPAATVLPSFEHTGAVLPFGLLQVAAWTVGGAVRQHRRQTDRLLHDQARQAEAEVERARRQVGDERIRIARELHDVVAHSMSVITVQAAYGRLVIDRQPATAREALAVIETTGRETLTELRRVLDLLRGDEPTGADPTPGLAGLPRLVEQTASAGVAVQLTIDGEPRALPPGLELSAYRIVQEAITNVVKHAGTDRARVLIGYEPDALVLDITDDGRGGSPTATGHGLVGMRERVVLYGGTLCAGPRRDGGFAVNVRLPAPAGVPAP